MNESYYRKYEASPIFTFKNSELNASGQEIIDFGQQDETTQKYIPFNALRIVNNSSSDIKFYPNQRESGMLIPAGTIMTFDSSTLPAIRSVKIVNNDSVNAISADAIQIDVWREGIEMVNVFRKIHKALYKLLSAERSQLWINFYLCLLYLQ